MNFVEELQWRGMLQDMTPGIEKLLEKKPIRAYIGFDPTAPSLTIGNYVPIMLLRLFQDAGHQPIFLLGGATGRIGDPSGKDEERQLKSFEELDRNTEFQKQQALKFLNFDEGENKGLILNNIDFYKEMNVLDFLRDVGKNLTINYMMSKESVRNRMESGLSYTEFSYQLLQAYDFLCLYSKYDCPMQMGGSDQWGNITSGTEFIRRNIRDSKAYGLTCPLLTKADGKKFGKSEEGNIWLDPNMTSPYKFYQFWLNCDDADIPIFTRYFTLKSKEEIETREKEFRDDPRGLKKMLSEELTKRVHSEKDYQAVLQVSEILFNKKANREQLLAMDSSELKMVAEEIPFFNVPIELLKNGVALADLMAEHTQIVQSKGEARRAIKNNAVSLNKEKMTNHETRINHEQLLHGKFLMLENGKKNKFMILAS
jgi:tyrosyl-tRNA synthetase